MRPDDQHHEADHQRRGKAYGITSAERTMRSRTSRRRPRADRPTSRSRSGTGSTALPDPTEVVAALTAALKVALADAAVVSKFAGLGTTPVSADQATPEAHTKKLTEQIEVWRPLLTGG